MAPLRGEGQKRTYARGQPLLSGETVTPGDFRCERCGYELAVEEGKATNLPVCPSCRHERWQRA